jgi:hypothetical protein
MVNISMIGADIGVRRLTMLVFRNYLSKPIGCLVLLMMGHYFTYAKPWRGIVPLHTTRVAVEEKLGPPSMDRGDTVVYEYQDERASIEYSKGPCSVEFSPWNVPRDTVLSIWITPKSYLTAAHVESDKNMKKVRDEHRPQVIYYINEKDGIEYSVDEQTNLVGLVRYLPAAADNALKCPEPRNRLSETIEVAQYSTIPVAAEKRILNKFAKQIIRYTSINYASAQAFIYIYDNEQHRSSGSTIRAERAKAYLVNAHHIDPDRITILRAGQRKRFTIKLYLVPPGTAPPRLGFFISPKHAPISAEPSLDAPHGAC